LLLLEEMNRTRERRVRIAPAKKVIKPGPGAEKEPTP
jgi:hypothetical protein